MVQGMLTMASKLEGRVAQLERELTNLKDEVLQHKRTPAVPGKDAWRATGGMFKDDPCYDDMVRLGRAWRKRQPKC